MVTAPRSTRFLDSYPSLTFFIGIFIGLASWDLAMEAQKTMDAEGVDSVFTFYRVLQEGMSPSLLVLGIEFGVAVPAEQLLVSLGPVAMATAAEVEQMKSLALLCRNVHLIMLPLLVLPLFLSRVRQERSA